VISFFIGRYLAREWAEKEIEKRPKFKAVDVAVDRQGMWIIILVRFSPVFPFGLWYCLPTGEKGRKKSREIVFLFIPPPPTKQKTSNYLFGLTKVTFWKYWIATTIGLLP